MRYYISFFLAFLILAQACNSSQRTANGNASPEDKQHEFENKFINGLKAQMLGNTNDALEYFSSCLQLKPASAATRYQIANIYKEQKKTAPAIILMEEAVHEQSENVWYQLLLADLYVTDGQTRKGIEIYAQQLDKHPEKLNLAEKLANLYYTVGDYRNALEMYNYLESQLGVSEEITFAKNEIYMEQGNMQKVFEETKKIIEAYPNDFRYKGMLAEYYAADQQYEKALQIYHQLLENEPDNGLIQLSVANFYRLQGQHVQSLEYLEKAFANPNLQLEPKMQALLNDLYYAPESDDDNAKYSKLLYILIEAHPESTTPRALLSDYLINSEQYAEAQEQLETLLNKEKSDYRLWEQLFFTQLETKSFEKMYEYSSEAVELYPNQPMIFLFNGISAYETGRYQEAVDILYIGIDLVFDEKLKVEFYTYLGESYRKLGEHEKSDQAFDDALTLDPQNILLLNNYSYYLALRKETLTKAETMSRKCIEMQPKNATFLDTHAWVLFQNEKYTEALQYIEQAIENGGDSNASIVEHYGDILFKNNKKDNALQQWQKAMDMGGGSDKLQQKIEEKQFIEK